MLPPDSTDATWLEAVRAALPALSAGIYLNAGTCGPLPAETAAVLAQLAEHELRVGRADIPGFHEFLQRADEARAAVAAVLTADVDDIALTHGVTDGMNAAIGGIDWSPGDRVVTTRLEHPGGVGPLYVLRERRDVEVAFVDIGLGEDPERTVAALEAAIDERTRAIVISHVIWLTGAVMPVAEISRMAHERGVLAIVDGAQSAGAIPVDVAALGADAYAIPGQKWLLGPEGTGALAVRQPVRDRLRPSIAGYMSFERVDSSGDARFWSSARKFEGTGFHRPSITGLARSIGWLSMFVGLDRVYERGARLARATADRLAAIEGVEVLTPRDRMATLISFRVAGWTAEEVQDELGARVFAITRTIPPIDALRISVGFYNSEEELERFVGVVELLAAHTPTTVPARRGLTVLGGA